MRHTVFLPFREFILPSCFVMAPEDVEKWVLSQLELTMKRRKDLRCRIDMALVTRHESYTETLALERAESTITALSFSPRRVSTPMNGVVVLPSGVVFTPRQDHPQETLVSRAQGVLVNGIQVYRAWLAPSSSSASSF